MMYPDLETFGRESDVERMPEMKRSSYLENCNQIFVKGPALTKEILEKMNAEIVPKRTYLFGYEMKTKTVLFTAGLCLLFSLSCLGTVLLWCTNELDNLVRAQLVVANGSDSFTMWQNPSPKAIYNIYLFNYTNVDAFQNGLERKLNVEEVGPYAYEENLERINVDFIDDERVSFQERRSYKFRPDVSVGSQKDRVMVPNLPLLTGASLVKSKNYFARLAYSAMLSGFDQQPFINLAAHEFITGYDDKLYDISKMVSAFQNVETPEKFALLAAKLGVNPRVITMNNGRNDLNKLGIMEKVNGQSQFDYFATDLCNSIEGGDGAMYPPIKVQQKQTVHFVFPEICRRLPIVFEKEVTILNGQVPAYRYVIPEDIFDSPNEKPDNECYCTENGDICPLRGLFNTTSCNFGSPLFVSRPHFQKADPILLQGVTGLNPEGKDFKCFMNLHPTLGFTMTARSNLQMNIHVQKAFGVSQLDMFEEDMMLPVAWLDVTLYEDQLPQDFLDLIYLTSVTYETVKVALKFGCLLTALITFVCLLLVFKRRAARKASCRQTRRISTVLE